MIKQNPEKGIFMFVSRRNFILSGLLAGAALALPHSLQAARTDELGNELTDYDDIISYNNFYEFSTSKDDVKEVAKGFPVSPWEVKVDGLCENPRTFGLEDLMAIESEERIYRLRCVEAWSMVVPWKGFELNKLLSKVKPLSNAKYVMFQTALDKDYMPTTRRNFPWPYIEGLRMDEANHPLTILATGIDGKDLPIQNGAPVRLVAPWKYGFKSIKTIVRITLTEEQPVSFWTKMAPREYGFYANVNPNVRHPRWSQARERRIGEFFRRDTLMFNGYEKQVASLYTGLDLVKNF